MKHTITFFPVENGDMTLIKLSDRTTILIDINVFQVNEDDKTKLDAIKELRSKLEKDDNGRPYVDVFVLSHPDQDHCRGLKKYFHLGSLDEYNVKPKADEELKIIMKELWSSPIIFRRASKNNTLCDDANAFNSEARRRVKYFREKGKAGDGDRILIIGEDENGKTDDLQQILIKIDEEFNRVNGKENNSILMSVLGPLPIQDDEEAEEKLCKNHSSIIIRYSFKVDNKQDACLFLTGGDSEVYIWEKLWEKHKDNIKSLEYDILLAPHHCSWHSLSYDSWSDDDDPQVNDEAKLSLSQARNSAFIISSSKPIKDDDNDPPCWGAKKEYEAIIDDVSGDFLCTGEYPNEDSPEPIILTISREGPQAPSKKSTGIEGPAVITGSTKEPIHHG